jgi:glycogen operon protein
MLTTLRKRRDIVAEQPLTLNELLSRARLEWHGVRLNHPDWSEHSHSLAFTLTSLRARFRLHGMLNAYWEPLAFEVPRTSDASSHRWRRLIDTALASPDDVTPFDSAPEVTQTTYLVQPRSVAVLILALQAQHPAFHSRR